VRFVAAVLAAASVLACGREPASKPPTPAPTPTSSPASPPCAGVRLEGEPQSYEEGTNPTISDYDVGISNIFARELPDDAGVVAKRLSASLSIHDPKTSSLRHEIVVPGNIVTIGADRYCVTSVDYGSDPKPGSVFLQKLALD
jgi:hypothetical protein